MRNRVLLVGFVFILAMAWSMNAFAGDAGAGTGWQGFCDSVGGFFYNALPWNWGNWLGK